MSGPGKYSICIDLNRRDEVGRLSADQLVQKEAIDKFAACLTEIYTDAVKANAEYGRSLSPFDRMLHRRHTTIMLNGDRGSGKTTLLNNLIERVNNDNSDLFSDKEAIKGLELSKIHVLGIIDPGLLETKEHLLITIVCLVKNAVDKRLEDKEDGKRTRHHWDEILNQLSEGLTRLDKIGKKDLHEDWEDALYIVQKGLQGAQGSIEFEVALFKFFHEALQILQKCLFLIAFDDIDTAIHRGFDVLEIIRKYLATPLIGVIVAGDIDLYAKIVRSHFVGQFSHGHMRPTDERSQLRKVDQLEDQYLMKLFKPSHRIDLLRLSEISEQYQLLIKDFSSNETPLTEFVDSACQRLFKIRRQDELKLYRSLLLRQPTRMIVQFLQAFARTRAEATAANSAVYRTIAEIALGPLLRSDITIDDLTRAEPQERLLMLRDFLHNKDLWASGHRLTPDLRDADGDDLNLVVLALAAPLIAELRQNPALIFDYLIKICLPHSASGYVPRQNVDMRSYLEFISGKSMEDSITEARQNIAVVVGSQKKNWTVARGVIRVVSRNQSSEAVRALISRKSKTEKDAGLQAFWALTNGRVPLEKTVNDKPKYESARSYIDYNTIVSLAGIGDDETPGTNSPPKRGIIQNEPMRKLAILPFVDVVSATGSASTYCSVLNLIGALAEIASGKNDMNSLENTFSRITQLLSFPVPRWDTEFFSDIPEETEDIQEDSDSSTSDPLPEGNTNNALLGAVSAWCTYFSNQVTRQDSLNFHLLARIWSRFYYTLIGIESAVHRNDQFLGKLLHRQIIAFLSAVLIEEMNEVLLRSTSEDARIVPSDVNPTGSDESFLNNLGKVLRLNKESNFSNLAGQKTVKADSADSEPNSLNYSSVWKEADWENNYPLFSALFACPLWACYLSPEATMLREHGGSSLRLLDVQVMHWAQWAPDAPKDSVENAVQHAKALLKVQYKADRKKEGSVSFDNLYAPLSSILVAAGTGSARSS